MAKETRSEASLLAADSPAGQEAIAILCEQYKRAQLKPDRGQRLVGNKEFAIRLRNLISRYTLPFEVPKKLRVIALWVSVDPGRDWEEAVRAAYYGDTSPVNAGKGSDKYPPQKGDIVDVEIFLCKLGRGSLAEIQKWGDERGLVPTMPRALFALSEQYPNLDRELGVYSLSVSSTTFEATKDEVPFVSWLAKGKYRSAGIGEYVAAHTYDDSSSKIWYAFSPK